MPVTQSCYKMPQYKHEQKVQSFEGCTLISGKMNFIVGIIHGIEKSARIFRLDRCGYELCLHYLINIARELSVFCK